ncbi:Choline/ethanolamine kinase [Blattella germanica]|nr:Choline/ethanolamine kinase [Blattella germanica]
MGIKDKMSSDNVEMREMAARICRDYLHGSWRKITARDIVLKRISGGLSNWLYHVSLPETHPPKSSEPSQVLLRLYGQIHGTERALEGLITESVIFTLLSERRLGPKLHGVFPGGRIEEYIPARPLKTKELGDPKLSVLIAEKMASIHHMNVPINKEPRWLWDTINGKYLSRVPSRVVFCHNDMQEGNILLCCENMTDKEAMQDPRLVLIDFEYCSYNYRGFDLANHFLEWVYDYTNTAHPYFSANKQNYPTREQQEYAVERLESYFQLKNKILSTSVISTPAETGVKRKIQDLES